MQNAATKKYHIIKKEVRRHKAIKDELRSNDLLKCYYNLESIDFEPTYYNLGPKLNLPIKGVILKNKLCKN